MYVRMLTSYPPPPSHPSDPAHVEGDGGGRVGPRDQYLHPPPPLWTRESSPPPPPLLVVSPPPHFIPLRFSCRFWRLPAYHTHPSHTAPPHPNLLPDPPFSWCAPLCAAAPTCVSSPDLLESPAIPQKPTPPSHPGLATTAPPLPTAITAEQRNGSATLTGYPALSLNHPLRGVPSLGML